MGHSCNHESYLVLAANILKHAAAQVQHDAQNPQYSPVQQAAMANAIYSIQSAYAGIASALLLHKEVGHGEKIEVGFTPDQDAINLVAAVEKVIDEHLKDHPPTVDGEIISSPPGNDPPPTPGGLPN